MSYPPGFESWSEEDRNAYFAREAERWDAQRKAAEARRRAADAGNGVGPDVPPPGSEGDYGGGAKPWPNGHDTGAEAASPELQVFNVGSETGDIPPREWLLGSIFCRKVLSALIGAGASGKTTIRLLQLLDGAANTRLSGEHVFVRFRSMVVCLDDDLVELRRRTRATMLRHGLKPSDVDGYLFLTSPRLLKIAEYAKGRKGGAVVAGGLYRALAAQVDKLGLDLVCIDPAVKAHALDENDNGAIDGFAALLTNLAIEKNIAIDLCTHERKGAGEAGDVERGRGAGSQKDAARLVYTITGMKQDEAAKLDVTEEARRYLVRVDSAKVNIAPPSTQATWFRLVGVELGNGNEIYPNGDTVQAAERWSPPPLFAAMSTEDVNRVLSRIDSGMTDGQRYSNHQSAKERHAWRAVQEEFPDIPESRCRAMVAQWDKNGLFEVGDYDDPARRRPAKGIIRCKKIRDGEDGKIPI